MKNNILIVSSMVILSLSSCEKKVNGLTANCVKGDATSITDTIWDVSEKFGEVVKDSIILPIKPIYSDMILVGKKKYEYRKKLCRKDIEKIYIYSNPKYSIQSCILFFVNFTLSSKGNACLNFSLYLSMQLLRFILILLYLSTACIICQALIHY